MTSSVAAHFFRAKALQTGPSVVEYGTSGEDATARPVRLAVQDTWFSARGSGVRIPYGLPNKKPRTLSSEFLGFFHSWVPRHHSRVLPSHSQVFRRW